MRSQSLQIEDPLHNSQFGHTEQTHLEVRQPAQDKKNRLVKSLPYCFTTFWLGTFCTQIGKWFSDDLLKT